MGPHPHITTPILQRVSHNRHIEGDSPHIARIQRGVVVWRYLATPPTPFFSPTLLPPLSLWDRGGGEGGTFSWRQLSRFPMKKGETERTNDQTTTTTHHTSRINHGRIPSLGRSGGDGERRPAHHTPTGGEVGRTLSRRQGEESSRENSLEEHHLTTCKHKQLREGVRRWRRRRLCCCILVLAVTNVQPHGGEGDFFKRG